MSKPKCSKCKSIKWVNTMAWMSNSEWYLCSKCGEKIGLEKLIKARKESEVI